METGKRANEVRLSGLFISELISNADYYAIGRANRDIGSGNYTQMTDGMYSFFIRT